MLACQALNCLSSLGSVRFHLVFRGGSLPLALDIAANQYVFARRGFSGLGHGRLLNRIFRSIYLIENSGKIQPDYLIFIVD